jgi:hypothetical protein
MNNKQEKAMKLFQVTMYEDNNASCIRTVYAIAAGIGQAAAKAVKANPHNLIRPHVTEVKLLTNELAR